MKNLRDVIEILRGQREELRERYRVREIGVFGSYARGEQGVASDIDLIVEFDDEGSIGGLELVGLMSDLEEYLGRILGIRPHLASKRHAMGSDKWEEIKREVVYLFETVDIEQMIRGIIAETLGEAGISLSRVILFGSRARGDFNRFSDYDILVIIDRVLEPREKMVLSEKIRDNLVKLHIPTDIIVKSEEEVSYYRDKIGSLVREALKEGVSV